MSHPQHRKLSKNQFELETALANERTISSSSSFSPNSSYHSSSSFHSTPSVRIGGEQACFNVHKTRHHHFTRLLHFTDHHGRKLISLSCFRPWGRLKQRLNGSFSHIASPNNDDNVSFDFGKKRVNGQKKEELEREVYMLNEMLAHEQEVHQYLDQLHHRKDGSALNIPSSLPPNMMEMLTELAMVENEIAQLESQIKKLKSEVICNFYQLSRLIGSDYKIANFASKF
ncbi:hypothetical protein CASFOL_002691 [Castilleja foliolosa]|uniref:Ternary complex factor MIP1 leucine-zipper domain-containing protein n=1 Tax=Castilleja foliolosa TaxID=1961234 RepID=A0ABD3EF07_9LAMI